MMMHPKIKTSKSKNLISPLYDVKPTAKIGTKKYKEIVVF
jgi:hypothetical protein